MHTMCSREIFAKKCWQQQIFNSDPKGAWHYNHVTFTPIAKNFMLYCRLIYMLSILCVRLTIKVKVGIPESFKVGWYPPKKTGSSHLKNAKFAQTFTKEVVMTGVRERWKLHILQLVHKPRRPTKWVRGPSAKACTLKVGRIYELKIRDSLLIMFRFSHTFVFIKLKLFVRAY